MAAYEHKAIYEYDYKRSPDQDASEPVRHPVIVVGAGPIGLATAIDLGQRGVPVVLLDDNSRIGEGSRAICFSKRALEVCDKLGVAERMVEKGVTWQVGKVYLEDDEVYSFDLLPEEGHKQPAFINLQQYYVEAYLVDRAYEIDEIDLRWLNKVVAVEHLNDGVRVDVETPDGIYQMTTDWLVACDGARSEIRSMMGLDFTGKVFQDRFLIADVKMTAPFPSERWFWFEPPFHKGWSALLHKQPDDVWRIDLQLGPEADADEETKVENVVPRLKKMLGGEIKFDLEWVSLYTFQCKRMERFIHGRVVFAGDAAHQVSPFGARGANSGFEDAQNLAWKLEAIIKGQTGADLMESYCTERELAADDNIGHSTRATDFISPKSKIARTFRNATLNLAARAPFARSMVNSGRLSTPSAYANSPLNIPDNVEFAGVAKLGAAAVDAPLKTGGGADTWLLDELGTGFTAIVVEDGAIPKELPGMSVKVLGDDLHDVEGLFAERYDAQPGNVFLFRPDQYMCARFRQFDPGELKVACQHAMKSA
ncbi:MAG: FAD-dependent oxidoreductase [Hyphomicrobiales bacterium]